MRKLHAANVPFLAGTDTPSGVDVIPGVSLHLELQRFVAAGFTPLGALQTATLNPADFYTTGEATLARWKLPDCRSCSAPGQSFREHRQHAQDRGCGDRRALSFQRGSRATPQPAKAARRW